MAMEMVLALQKLEVPEIDAHYASSCTSSVSNCCGAKPH